MHERTLGHGVDRVGGGERVGGVGVGVGVSGVGAPADAAETDGAARAGILSWLAGPYGDEPVNRDLTYSAAEIEALADHWNRVLFVRLAVAGGLSGVRPSGVCRPPTVGVK